MDEKMDNKIEPTAVSDENVEVEVHYKEMSPAMMIMRRFFRSRLSLVGVILLVALFAFSFLGPPVLHLFGYQWGEIDTDLTPTVKRASMTLEDATTDLEGNSYDVIQFIEKEVGINY